MDENDFSRIGRDIRDGITDAVNAAVRSMDFSRLNSMISSTIDSALRETSNAFQDAVRGTGSAVYDAFEGIDSRRHGQRGRKETGFMKEYRKQMEQLQTTLTVKMPGKVSGILMTVFGSIGLAGFGIPMLVLSAVGLGAVSIPLLMLGLVAFGPLTAASAVMLKCGIGKTARVRRYEVYKRCIGSKPLCAIRTLALAVGRSEKAVCREIESLIAAGYFPQSHLDDERTCIIMNDETYALYLQSKRNMTQAGQTAGSAQQTGAKADKAKQEDVRSQSSQTAKDKSFQEAIDTGMQYIRQIRRINEELPEPVITAKLTHLEDVIGLIYLRVQKTPDKLGSLKRFTDYYLPTTLRLVQTYRELAGSQMQTANITESKKQIEETLDTINLAFDKLLDSMYEEERMNIQTDISVLRTLLAQEGLTDDGLHSMDDIFSVPKGSV